MFFPCCAQICQVSVEAGVPMEFGGSTDPTVFVKYITLQDTRMAGDIVSIGGGKNARISARLAEVFNDMLKCPKWRTYVDVSLLVPNVCT